MIVEAIKKLVEGYALSPELAAKSMYEIMSGRATHAQIAAFLVALRLRGESPAIIAAMARVMRDFAKTVKISSRGRLIDTCGTGGDCIKTINVSTASGLIVAASGGYVAKHGNRSFTGYCGSADLLEEVGVRISLEPDRVAKCVESLGFGFIYAPAYHTSMRNVMPVRREIAIRTIFNILGPLTNPAPVNAQVLGVFSEEFLKNIAEALKLLGREEALIFHGVGGFDEISIFSETEAIWLKDGAILRKRLSPSDFGVEKARVEEIVINDRRECIKKTIEVLAGRLGRNHPITRLLLVNSAVSLLIAGLSDDLKYGVEQAWHIIESGKPIKLLEALVKETGGDRMRFEKIMEGIE